MRSLPEFLEHVYDEKMLHRIQIFLHQSEIICYINFPQTFFSQLFDRERERGSSILWFTLRCLQVERLGAKNSIQVSHVGSRTQHHEPSPAVCEGVQQQEMGIWDQRWDSRWDVGILTARTNT